MSVHGLEDKSTGQGGLRFDKTISLGHVLSIMTMMAGIGAAYAAYQVTIGNIEMRIQFLEAQSKSQMSTNIDLVSSMYNIQRDVAVIKDRLERK